MKYNARKIICCGAAGMTVLASLAGCNAKIDTSVSVTSEVKQNTVPTTVETAPDLEPVVSPYSDQWPVKTGSLGDLEYNLQSVTIDFQSQDRGYYIFSVEEKDYPVNIIISAGEFSTGGYDICIVDMDYDSKTFTVTVREIYPEPTDVVIEAFTYPCCEIQLNKLPGSVRVVDENGNELDEEDRTNQKVQIDPAAGPPLSKTAQARSCTKHTSMKPLMVNIPISMSYQLR